MKYIVSVGRKDGTAIKHLFYHSRTRAITAAQSLAYVLFKRNAFKPGECHGRALAEGDEFFVEYVESEGEFR